MIVKSIFFKINDKKELIVRGEVYILKDNFRKVNE